MDTLGEPVWIGQYRLTSRLATGGMAEVYIGRHISPEGEFGPMVAVKRLLPHLAKDTTVVRMFLNEARITAQIRHPNVVKIFELGQVNGEPFIAMELLDGRTWAELRQGAAERAQRMPVGIALRVLIDACRGLDAAHRAVDEHGQPLALVHRDFTPDNIHVGNDGAVKVIDFGVARTNAWGAGTEPGTLKGKFFYMSPEMIAGEQVDHRADLFAAGVMLYEQLCGRRPFTGHSVDEVVMRIARDEAVHPSTYDPAVPPALAAICLQALAKNPAQRYSSLADFVSALEHADAAVASASDVAHYVTTLFPEERDERRSTLRRARQMDPSVPALVRPPAAVNSSVPRRWRRWALAGVAFALVLVGGTWAWQRQQQSLSPRELLTEGESAQGSERVRLLLALTAHPDSTHAQRAQASALLMENREWEAILRLTEKWLEREPQNFDARLAEAQAAIHVRQGKRAQMAIQEAQQLKPNDARPDALLAELKELQADSYGALDAWAQAATKSPRNIHYLARQGYWLSQTGKLDEAESLLTQVSRKGAPPQATAELGFVKFRKGQRDEALRILRNVVKENPTLFEGHYYLAAVWFQKGDAVQARAEYETASAINPADPRPLVAQCEMEAMLRSEHLEAVRRDIKKRFPKDAATLLSKCSASEVPP